MRRIGFVGLGAMGAPIARRLLRAGHPLVVCDLDAATVARFVAEGATAAPTPAATAAACDVVMSMVPDAPDVEKVALGPGGLIEGLRKGQIYVDMSTVDPSTTRRVGAALAAKGVRMIDCPVGRTTKHAEEGKLVLMIGGADADIDEAMPLFAHLADTFIRCGPLGTGSATKVVNNYLAITCCAVSAEAFTLGVRAGLTVEHMLKVFGSTMAANAQALQAYPQFALAGNVTPGFMAALGHKDLRLGLTMAREYGMTARVGTGAFDSLGEAREKGHGRDDVTVMLKLREAEAGVKVRLAGKG
jgi:3-hydroxyisobutyrate dehydrogenase-like beta-hydroxyacid dehydrogenase